MAIGVGPARAQTFTWTGKDPVSPLWSKVENWKGDKDPPKGGGAGVTLDFTGLTKAKGSLNNLGVGKMPTFTLNELKLGSTVKQTITGQLTAPGRYTGLTFVKSPNPKAALPSIVQTGPGDFTISKSPIALEAALQITGDGKGAVVLGGGVPGGKPGITGAGSITMAGQGSLSLFGNNDYSEGTAR